MKRRTVIQVIALGPLSIRLDAWVAMGGAQSNERTAWAARDYKLQFFTPAENDLLDRLMEIIIPADGHSGGAHAPQVSLFADWVVSTGIDIDNVDLFANRTVDSDAQKSDWCKGLEQFKEEAEKSSVSEVLARASAGEESPQTDLERFFVTLKQMTLVGYYTSEIGINQDLEYQGNTYVSEFPECTHH